MGTNRVPGHFWFGTEFTKHWDGVIPKPLQIGRGRQESVKANF